LGRWTVPVYEIYKAGADPVWVDGLDLLGPAGLDVAVIPHYDNAEGGTHDTRYCYLGEARLRAMEAQLPPGAWVLGVDEHTACIFDFPAGTFTVLGLGSVTVRRQGESVTLPTGHRMGIDALKVLAARGVGGGGAAATSAGPPGAGAQGQPDAEAAGVDGPEAGDSPLDAGALARPGGSQSPLTAEASGISAAFDDALAHRDARAATEALLQLEATLHAWSADTFESDDMDRARAGLRRNLLHLGEAAGPGLRDPRELAQPWVEALLVERDEARRSRRFADADRVRKSLEVAGVEVRDTPAGTEWDLRPRPAP
jgi:hypothetical protein